MERAPRFENYPSWIVLTATGFSFATYALGAFVISRLGWLFVVLYLAFCTFTELRVVATSCRGCYYYGKTCFSGKGRLSALLFERSPPGTMAAKEITWRSIVPDFMVLILPAVVGIGLLLVEFEWMILGAIILLVLLATLGSAKLRGSLACRYCKQRDLGCPAEKLFRAKPRTE